jgi:hypothetical protein
MAKHRPGGAFYSTDDLYKMAQLGHFGTYSLVIARALSRLKSLENENAALKEILESYERIDEIQSNYDNVEAPQVNLDDLEQNY